MPLYRGTRYPLLGRRTLSPAHILVGAIGRTESTTNRSIASITVGGVAATSKLTLPQDTGRNYGAFFLAPAPAGPTATIVVDWDGSANMNRCAIGVWRLTGLISETAHDTMTDDTISSGVLSGVLDNPANGFDALIAYGALSGLDWTVAGLTERGQGATFASVVADGFFAAAQTNLAISATHTDTAGTNALMLGISFGCGAGVLTAFIEDEVNQNTYTFTDTAIL